MQLSSTVQASLVQTDLYTAGDSLLLYDTEAKTEWLSASIFSGTTVVTPPLTSQRLFDLGFRAATDAQIQLLLNDAGVDRITDEGNYNPIATENNFAAFNLLKDILKVLDTNCGYDYDMCDYGTELGTHALISTDYVNDTRTYYVFGVVGSLATVTTVTLLALHPELTGAVVRTVPLPGSAWLMISSLIFAFGFNRKRLG